MAKEAYDVNKMPKKNPLSLQIDLQKFEKATEEEKKQADVMSESTSFFRDGMRKLRRNPTLRQRRMRMGFPLATVIPSASPLTAFPSIRSLQRSGL